jgi:hypothetical protein
MVEFDDVLKKENDNIAMQGEYDNIESDLKTSMGEEKKPNLFMRAYYSLEDTHYSLMEKLGLEKVVDKIDKVVPSFILCNLILLIIIFLIVYFVFLGSTMSVTFEFYKDNTQVTNDLNVFFSYGEVSINELVQNGRISLDLPEGEDVTVRVATPGYVIATTFTIIDQTYRINIPATINLDGENQGQEIEKLIIYFYESGKLFSQSIQANLKCLQSSENKTTSIVGRYEYNKPEGCGAVKVTATKSGYENIEKTCSSTLCEIHLRALTGNVPDPTPARGGLRIIVKEDQNYINNALVTIRKGVVTQQDFTNLSGYVDFVNLPEGSYTVTASDNVSGLTKTMLVSVYSSLRTVTLQLGTDDSGNRLDYDAMLKVNLESEDNEDCQSRLYVYSMDDNERDEYIGNYNIDCGESANVALEETGDYSLDVGLRGGYDANYMPILEYEVTVSRDKNITLELENLDYEEITKINVLVNDPYGGHPSEVVVDPYLLGLRTGVYEEKETDIDGRVYFYLLEGDYNLLAGGEGQRYEGYAELELEENNNADELVEKDLNIKLSVGKAQIIVNAVDEDGTKLKDYDVEVFFNGDSLVEDRIDVTDDKIINVPVGTMYVKLSKTGLLSFYSESITLAIGDTYNLGGVLMQSPIALDAQVEVVAAYSDSKLTQPLTRIDEDTYNYYYLANVVLPLGYQDAYDDEILHALFVADNLLNDNYSTFKIAWLDSFADTVYSNNYTESNLLGDNGLYKFARLNIAVENPGYYRAIISVTPNQELELGEALVLRFYDKREDAALILNNALAEKYALYYGERYICDEPMCVDIYNFEENAELNDQDPVEPVLDEPQFLGGTGRSGLFVDNPRDIADLGNNYQQYSGLGFTQLGTGIQGGLQIGTIGIGFPGFETNGISIEDGKVNSEITFNNDIYKNNQNFSLTSDNESSITNIEKDFTPPINIYPHSKLGVNFDIEMFNSSILNYCFKVGSNLCGLAKDILINTNKTKITAVAGIPSFLVPRIWNTINTLQVYENGSLIEDYQVSVTNQSNSFISCNALRNSTCRFSNGVLEISPRNLGDEVFFKFSTARVGRDYVFGPINVLEKNIDITSIPLINIKIPEMDSPAENKIGIKNLTDQEINFLFDESEILNDCVAGIGCGSEAFYNQVINSITLTNDGLDASEDDNISLQIDFNEDYLLRYPGDLPRLDLYLDINYEFNLPDQADLSDLPEEMRSNYISFDGMGFKPRRTEIPTIISINANTGAVLGDNENTLDIIPGDQSGIAPILSDIPVSEDKSKLRIPLHIVFTRGNSLDVSCLDMELYKNNILTLNASNILDTDDLKLKIENNCIGLNSIVLDLKSDKKIILSNESEELELIGDSILELDGLAEYGSKVEYDLKINSSDDSININEIKSEILLSLRAYQMIVDNPQIFKERIYNLNYIRDPSKCVLLDVSDEEGYSPDRYFRCDGEFCNTKFIRFKQNESELNLELIDLCNLSNTAFNLLQENTIRSITGNNNILLSKNTYRLKSGAAKLQIRSNDKLIDEYYINIEGTEEDEVNETVNPLFLEDPFIPKTLENQILYHSPKDLFEKINNLESQFFNPNKCYFILDKNPTSGSICNNLGEELSQFILDSVPDVLTENVIGLVGDCDSSEYLPSFKKLYEESVDTSGNDSAEIAIYSKKDSLGIPVCKGISNSDKVVYDDIESKLDEFISFETKTCRFGGITGKGAVSKQNFFESNNNKNCEENFCSAFDLDQDINNSLTYQTLKQNVKLMNDLFSEAVFINAENQFGNLRLNIAKTNSEELIVGTYLSEFSNIPDVDNNLNIYFRHRPALEFPFYYMPFNGSNDLDEFGTSMSLNIFQEPLYASSGGLNHYIVESRSKAEAETSLEEITVLEFKNNNIIYSFFSNNKMFIYNKILNVDSSIELDFPNSIQYEELSKGWFVKRQDLIYSAQGFLKFEELADGIKIINKTNESLTLYYLSFKDIELEGFTKEPYESAINSMETVFNALESEDLCYLEKDQEQIYYLNIPKIIESN